MTHTTTPLHVTIPRATQLDAPLPLGTAQAPDGHEITVDSRCLRRDGRPWLPVMGEFHYSRYPEAEWRDELLKMRMGGIDIVATYVFWIHHEEIEGVWDWSGRRDLRAFVSLCGELGLHIVVRLGPWCHGEVRNGGLPDWLIGKDFLPRSDSPGYLEYAARFYHQIAAQIKGRLWKDGGPVIGIQMENEYGGPAEHLIRLKRLAIEAGLDVPLYTRTGWPELSTLMPPGELLPLFGGYPDGFWDRTLEEMPDSYRRNFLFLSTRTDTGVGTDQLGAREAKDGDDTAQYPYFACEIGGGMEPSYHRRIQIAPRDIEALALVKIGSGNNLQGYYMYHGGTNPEGRLSTLQESQATGYWNDVPVKSYDFQAPLGEFGQIREHYHRLRRMHLFLRDFGPSLAGMPLLLPDSSPLSAADLETVRWAVRSDGRSGFLFVSNYQRLQPMPMKAGVQFEMCLPAACLRIPQEPVTIPANTSFFWPFGLDLNGIPLAYATAQPVCHIEDRGTRYFVFARTADVPVEFVFPEAGIHVEGANALVARRDGKIRVGPVEPGTEIAFRLRSGSESGIAVVVLDEPQSRACWKGELAGQERLFLTRAGLIVEGNRLRLSACESDDLSVGIFPAPDSLSHAGHPLAGTTDGLFRRFTALPSQAAPVAAVWEQIRHAGPLRTIRNGGEGVAEAPTDADFDQAAIWRIGLLDDAEARRDLYLRIRYTGDVARLYWNGSLLTDDFYNGDAFEFGLKRHVSIRASGELLLKILPLHRDAPIYLPRAAWPDFGAKTSLAALHGIDVIEEQTIEFSAG